jgi:hypothetical protein
VALKLMTSLTPCDVSRQGKSIDSVSNSLTLELTPVDRRIHRAQQQRVEEVGGLRW